MCRRRGDVPVRGKRSAGLELGTLLGRMPMVRRLAFFLLLIPEHVTAH